jgi:hypothetical protein
LGVKSKNTVGVKTHAIEGEKTQEMKTSSWEMKTSASHGVKTIYRGGKIPGN